MNPVENRDLCVQNTLRWIVAPAPRGGAAEGSNKETSPTEFVARLGDWATGRLARATCRARTCAGPCAQQREAAQRAHFSTKVFVWF